MDFQSIVIVILVAALAILGTSMYLSWKAKEARKAQIRKGVKVVSSIFNKKG